MAETGGRLEGRVALITGASRGIGAGAAIALAKAGAHVILVARTEGGLTETDDAIRAGGGSATLVPLDLADFEQIDRMAISVAERFGRLDILIGNAAMLGMMGPTGHIDPEIWEQAFALNVTANFRLIRAFDAMLRASDAGRAIFITSGVASKIRPYWGPYPPTKAALERMVLNYAAEMEKTNLRANILDPGILRTRLRAQGFPGEDPMDHPEPESIAHIFVDLADPACERTGEVVTARDYPPEK